MMVHCDKIQFRNEPYDYRELTPVLSGIKNGTDPEFEVRKNGRICKARTVMPYRSYRDAFGTDGCPDVAEARPNPGSPEQVVSNLEGLIREFHKDFPGVDLCTTGNKYAVGAHLHLSIPDEIHGVKPLRVPASLLMVFDACLAKPVWSLNGSARGNYAQLSSCREQPHGFEYRSCPSAIMSNPVIARIAFKILREVTKYYLTHETMEFNDIFTVEDYVKYAGLTEDEARAYLGFAEDYINNDRGRRIMAYWLADMQTVQPTRNVASEYSGEIPFADGSVIFNSGDSFSEQVITGLESMVMAYLNKVRVPVCVNFYGLAASRGSVSTIRLGDHYRTIRNVPVNFPMRNRATMTVNIGLPYDIRLNEQEFTRLKDVILSRVKEQVCLLMEAEYGTRWWFQRNAQRRAAREAQQMNNSQVQE